MQVLVIGAAVLDITARPIEKSGNWAEKQRIENIKFTVGGDAANQSAHLADAGIEVGILSAIGSDRNGEIIKTELKSRGVNTEHLLEKAQYPTGTSLILLDAKAERTVFSVRGGAYAFLNKKDTEKVLTSELKALSIASFFIEKDLESDGGMEECLKKARQMGILTFADLSHDKNNLGLKGIKPFLPHLDYFLPSLYDAEKMNGVKGAEKNARIYKELGCNNVIIKCGAEGCYIHSDEYTGYIAAHNIKPLDTTGAGDCMVALFIERILNGYKINDACSFACAGASYSTLFYGACSKKISISEVESFVSKTPRPEKSSR